MKPLMERRLRQFRSRVLVRSWEYRQRRHARGAWFRLRRVLTFAAAAYIASPDDARQLVAEGCHPEPAGEEFDPPQLIVFAPRERIARLHDARPVPVRLDRDLLAATCLVLVPFVTPPSRGRTPRA